MKIRVAPSAGPKINIRLPNWLIFNPLSTSLIVKALGQKEVPENQNAAAAREGLKRILCELNRCRQQFPGLVLVDVKASDGTEVEIHL